MGPEKFAARATAIKNGETKPKLIAPKLTASSAHARSAVTNGKIFLQGVDGRSLIGRRYRDIANAIEADQGDDIAEVRKHLIRRFAACACMAEEIEAAVAMGEKYDTDEHAKLVSSLVRLANKIGLDRIPRDVSPTLDGYLSGRPTRARRKVLDDPDDVE